MQIYLASFTFVFDEPLHYCPQGVMSYFCNDLYLPNKLTVTDVFL